MGRQLPDNLLEVSGLTPCGTGILDESQDGASLSIAWPTAALLHGEEEVGRLVF